MIIISLQGCSPPPPPGASWPTVLCLALLVLPAACPRITHWVEFVLVGPIWVSIWAPFEQAGASEKTAESAVRVITF